VNIRSRIIPTLALVKIPPRIIPTLALVKILLQIIPTLALVKIRSHQKISIFFSFSFFIHDPDISEQIEKKKYNSLRHAKFISTLSIFFIFLFFYFFLGLGPAQPTWAGLGPACLATGPNQWPGKINCTARVKQFHVCSNCAKVIKLPSHSSSFAQLKQE